MSTSFRVRKGLESGEGHALLLTVRANYGSNFPRALLCTLGGQDGLGAFLFIDELEEASVRVVGKDVSNFIRIKVINVSKEENLIGSRRTLEPTNLLLLHASSEVGVGRAEHEGEDQTGITQHGG